MLNFFGLLCANCWTMPGSTHWPVRLSSLPSIYNMSRRPCACGAAEVLFHRVSAHTSSSASIADQRRAIWRRDRDSACILHGKLLRPTAEACILKRTSARALLSASPCPSHRAILPMPISVLADCCGLRADDATPRGSHPAQQPL